MPGIGGGYIESCYAWSDPIDEKRWDHEQGKLPEPGIKASSRLTGEIPDEVTDCDVEEIQRCPGPDPRTEEPVSPGPQSEEQPMKRRREPCEPTAQLETEPDFGVSDVWHENVASDEKDEGRRAEERESGCPAGSGLH